jgi:hypothetical protein
MGKDSKLHDEILRAPWTYLYLGVMRDAEPEPFAIHTPTRVFHARR